MANYVSYSVTLGRKLLAVATTAAAILAITVGIDLRGAQPPPEPHAAFDVASVKPAAIWKSGGEGSNRFRIEYSPTSLSMRNGVSPGPCAAASVDSIVTRTRVRRFMIGRKPILTAAGLLREPGPTTITMQQSSRFVRALTALLLLLEYLPGAVRREVIDEDDLLLDIV